MRIDATYRVTTPLFLGGADIGGSPELRAPSLKGLLRFWFRAVAWPRLGSLQEVWREERCLFGSTSGQAAFVLSVSIAEKFSTASRGSALGKEGVAYLGYGLVDTRGNSVRPYLEPGGSFILRLDVKKEKPVQYVLWSLKALGLFGGAGARSRKGLGSLSLESLRLDGTEEWSQPPSAEKLGEKIKEFLKEIGLEGTTVSRPPYTAFSPAARVCVLKSGRDALALLNEIGRELLRYRSYGREAKGKHLLPWGEEAEQNFAPDHDLLLGYLGGGQVNCHPQRVVFGLPHNYYFKSANRKVNVTGKNYTRRASPLFFHVHSLGPNGYALVATLLPAPFLPAGEEIVISCPERKAGLQPASVRCNVDYAVIEAFFERTAFKSKVVVWP